MKKIIGLLLMLSFCVSLFGQTRMIAHKSHSGSIGDFAKAFHQNLFDLSNSNFGGIPQREVSNCILDSVLFYNDSLTIIVTSQKDTTLPNYSQWKPGRLEMINDKVFTRKKPLGELIYEIDDRFFFRNTASSVVFIDFDTVKTEVNVPINKEPNKTKQRGLKIQKNKKSSKAIRASLGSFDINGKHFNKNIPMLLGCLAFFSLGLGFMVWRFRQL